MAIERVFEIITFDWCRIHNVCTGIVHRVVKIKEFYMVGLALTKQAQKYILVLSQRGSKAAPENLSIQNPLGTDFWVDRVFLIDGRTQFVNPFCHFDITKLLIGGRW
jgi:hypothetical protein